METKERNIDKELGHRNQELYITLLRTFGIISITIPMVLFFVNEFMFEPSLFALMGFGAAIIIVSLVWGVVYKRSKKSKSQFVDTD
jgi:Flp pilus assembly protein TadB